MTKAGPPLRKSRLIKLEAFYYNNCKSLLLQDPYFNQIKDFGEITLPEIP